MLLAYGLTSAVTRLRWHAAARRPALYAIGIVAAYWCWLRIAASGSV